MPKSCLPPAALPELMARIESALACGRTAEAEALLIRAGTVAPRNFHIWNNLGVLCAKSRRYGEAERHFARAARLNPDNAGTQANLAQTLLTLGRLDEADRCVRKALRLDSCAAPVHKIAADIALRQNRPKTAIRHCEAALSLQPDWCEAINSLASALKLDGRLSDCVAALGRSAAIRPNDTAARNLVMGLTYDPACDDATLRSAQQDYATLVERNVEPMPALMTL